jgi:hypothetical protein
MTELLIPIPLVLKRSKPHSLVFPCGLFVDAYLNILHEFPISLLELHERAFYISLP